MPQRATRGFKVARHRRGALEDPTTKPGQFLDELLRDDLVPRIGAGLWDEMVEFLEQRTRERGAPSKLNDAQSHVEIGARSERCSHGKPPSRHSSKSQASPGQTHWRSYS